MNKIIDHKNVQELMLKLKSLNQTVVLVGGCFDILHLGHIRFLKEAKKHGEVIVALESDETLTKYKGKSRPIHKQSERAEMLSQLTTVDYVLLLPFFSSDQEYFDLTKTISPHIIAVTEGDPELSNKQKQADLVGAKTIVIPKIHTPSTTQLAKLLQLE